MDESLYKQQIIEIYNNMQHKYMMENSSCSQKGVNASCGDSIEVCLLTVDDKIDKASFTGDGCLLSQVSAEILLDKIEGMKKEDLINFTFEDLVTLIGINPTPSRIKCMDLARKTIIECITKNKKC